jgi:hypothetical protein
MIEKIKNPRLRISESIQFFNDVLTVCKNSNPAELNIANQWAELNKSYKLLSESFKKEQGSVLTADLVTLDYRRDQAVICLRKLADGYRNHHDEAKKKAGKLLVVTIDKYGKAIARMNYQAETSVLTNLATDLKDDAKNAAAVKLLGLGDTVTEMVTANTLFNNIFIERVGEAAAKDIASASDMVDECKEKFATLVTHIEANQTLTPSEGLSTLIKQMNSLIEKFNTMFAIRGGRKEGDQPQDDTPKEEE